jgi:hypothetical protein
MIHDPLAIIMGTLALLILIYRIKYVAIPIFMVGIASNDWATVFKSFTLLV